MKNFVANILEFYSVKMREPKLEELSPEAELLEKKGSCFVTLYLNGEVRGSAGNVKEISENLAKELYENTLSALTKDTRFTKPLTLDESKKLKFRVDLITDRAVISKEELTKLDPVKNGCIAIKRDYKKLAVILPNMSAKLLTGSDFIPVLLEKLSEKKFEEKEYIIYKIETQVESTI